VIVVAPKNISNIEKIFIGRYEYPKYIIRGPITTISNIRIFCDFTPEVEI